MRRPPSTRELDLLYMLRTRAALVSAAAVAMADDPTPAASETLADALGRMQAIGELLGRGLVVDPTRIRDARDRALAGLAQPQ
jgi:hypothetical protein